MSDGSSSGREVDEHLSLLANEAHRQKGIMAFKAGQPIIIRCYTGGATTNPHVTAFNEARVAVRNIVGNIFQVEYRDLRFFRDHDSYSQEDHMNWLLGGDIHFVLCYPHEGTGTFGFSVDRPLLLLQHHPGFPTERQVECPILTQDKFRYLSDLPSDKIMKTYSIPMSSDMDKDSFRETRLLVER